MSVPQKVNAIFFTTSDWRGFWWLWSFNPPCGMGLND
jgi:hypothetical protein